jgi:hypothetical protein
MAHDRPTSSEVLRSAGFSSQVNTRLAEHLNTIPGKGYDYPWPDLERAIDSSQDSCILLVGYGSLLSQKSAQRTLDPHSVDTSQPVLAMGASRVFNYCMPDAVVQRYGALEDPRARAALNAEYTKSPAAVLNGRLLRLYAKDVQALREREVGYDLRPVACVLWNAPEDPPFTAYVLACTHREWNGRRLTDDTLTPHLGYYELCRGGAESISPQFLSLYLRTTFCAAPFESAEEWERTHRVGPHSAP